MAFPMTAPFADLKRAIAINPNLADAHVELGKIYMHIGLLDKAIDANTQAFRLDPGSVAAHGATHPVVRLPARLHDRVAAGERMSHGQPPESGRSVGCAGRIDEALQLADSSATARRLSANWASSSL